VDDAAARGLIGRAREVLGATEALGVSRLVTLTGAPGIGKTRLARAVAEAYEGRSVVVELAPVADPALVPATLAAGLAVQEVPGRSLTDALIAHLRYGPLLVVLDNCEHVLDSAAAVVRELLDGCPQLRVLATSREPLALPNERVSRVPPLSVPERGELEDPGVLMERHAAVRLFVERAAAVDPRFALNAYVASAVVEICQRLDGIPLAIELAAARVEMLTPAEIAARLGDRFGLLIDRRHRLTGRHQTLQAALDWSNELLSEPERTLLRRLSVFAGGFDVDAVKAVCSGGEVDAGEVPALIARLVSKSLMVADAPQARYHVLESIRAYGAERLDAANEVRVLREAHAHFYLSLAEVAEPELYGSGQQHRLRQLESERANLRCAVDWSLAHGQGEWALRLTGSLSLFWRMRCHFTEGRTLLQAAIEAAGDDAPPAFRWKALWAAGALSNMAGDPGAAIPMLEESLRIAGQLGDIRARARTLMVLGGAKDRADPTALASLAESASLARETGDSWCLAHALGSAGLQRCYRDELSLARPLLDECVSVAREAKDSGGLRFGLLGLGDLAGRQGDFDLAQSAFEEALAVGNELGEDYTKATALMYLGQVAIARGEESRAGPLLDQAIALMRVAKPDELLASLVLRAMVARSEGDLSLARRLLEEALPLARAGDPSAPSALQALGDLHAREGNLRAARRLFDEALDLARSVANKRHEAWALQALAGLARTERDAKRAVVLLNEELELHRQIENVPAILGSLEAIASVAAEAGRYEHAARMLGAASALRKQHGHPRLPSNAPWCERDLQLARESLSARDFEAAFSAGAELSLDQAVAQASNGRGESRRRHEGWRTLTNTEQQVAALASEGMTNSEIADLLFVSPGTVKNHLSHIFSKLGVRRRTQLAREVTRDGGPRA
jgi:predicted ATPase/DNA-binding NarL/FixJ family response regulator